MRLEVTGWRSGRLVSFPLVVTTYQGERYLVSMLGRETNWVANVRAAGGAAVMRHRTAETVRLVEVDPSGTAPILRGFLQVAPGARAHFPVHEEDPLRDFERIAPDFPVFRVVPAA